MDLLRKQFSSDSCYPCSLRSSPSPQHLPTQHPQTALLHQNGKPEYIQRQYNRQNIDQNESENYFSSFV